MDVELFHDPCSMRLRRFRADIQQHSYLFGCFTLGNQLQDLKLPRAQRIAWGIDFVQEGIDNRIRYVGTQKR